MAKDDIYQVNTIYEQDGREWLNTYFYRVEVDDVTMNPPFIALKMALNWELQFFTARIQKLMVNECKLVAIVAQKKWPLPDQDVIHQTTSPGGSLFEQPLPAHTAAMFKQHGAGFGRSFQGRVFLSGVPRSFVSSGGINTDGMTEYQTWGTEPLGKNTWTVDAGFSLKVEHTNFSKKLVADEVDEPWSDIVAATIRPQLTTQRNRLATIIAPTTPL